MILMSLPRKENNSFLPFLSPLAVIAVALGTSLGWGSLVVTSNTYLKQAGPLGSALGLLIGGIIMLLVCRNYHYVANKDPDALGIYDYTKHIFGYDRAFLIAWFTFLLYLAIFWANATAIPLFARYIFGDFFRFGYLYTVFGYDVYLGEILLTVAGIAFTALLMVNSKRVVSYVMIGLVGIFFIGISATFIVAVVNCATGSVGMDPAFIPDTLPVKQVAKIACISPWAFIGFESVTHSTSEFNFPKKKLFRILAISVIVTTALYIMVTLLSVTAYPARYGSWLEYIRDLGNLSGIEALPAFYAAGHYLGHAGFVLLFLSLLSLVVTSLIANVWALSRLLYSVGQDSIMPEKFAELNKKNIPSKAILFVAAISLVIPFLGRSSIGWIVDVTTIVATLLYGFVAAAAMKSARSNHDKKEFVAGLIVLVVMAIFGVAMIVPGINSASLEAETYLLFIIWAIIGMIFFHRVIAKDRARHFGKAIIVWITLMAFEIFLGLVWMDKIENTVVQKAIAALEEYHAGTAAPEILAMTEEAYVALLDKQLSNTSILNMSVVFGLFVISAAGFVSNFFSMKKYEAALEKDVTAKAEHIIEMQNDLVVGMATMVESRDNSTGGHIKRTSEVVRILVDEMRKDKSLDLDETFYEDVIKAAPMHDLGKIAVDDMILRKPGRFTPEEYDIMKTHAAEGARIVAEILHNSDDETFKRIAENVAHYHHEKFDGTGYPEGLKGDEIPLEARIMAIADVYDALVSKRVYKEKMSFEEADRIILDGMGTQFDDSLAVYYKSARQKLEAYYSSGAN